ncbi:MAG: hypothetical protein FP829_01350, partial [Nitrospirae bacterium]|nr:hypothetical protein [Nitrospirota bacterium]
MPIDVSPLVDFKNADVVQEELNRKLAELNKTDSSKEPFMSSISNHIRSKWAQAQTAKIPIEARLNACKRAVRCQYDPKKLAAIQAIYGKDFDPPYPPVIATKRDDLVAWLKDSLLMPGVDLFSLEPTPMPDLPQGMEEQIKIRIEQKFFQIAASQSLQSGLPVDMQVIAQQIQELQPVIKDRVFEEMKHQSKESALRMTHKIKDQFAEGNFTSELKKFIDDIATYPSAFLRGPVQKKAKVKKRVMNVETGQWVTDIEEQIISSYERISPYNVYPVNNTADVNDTDLLILTANTASDLSDLIDVEGYDSDAIREVLSLYRSGGLKEWTNVTAERDSLDEKDSSSNYDFIDCLEYQGTASGRMLVEWAGSEPSALALFGMELDDEKEYQIVAWLIGTYVIKAMLNPDSLGKKDISKTGFSTDPDNFWGHTSLPEKLWSDQSQCNALSRGIVLNVGFAAGPQVEYDKDRFPEGISPNFYPLKQWAATGAQMAGGKAVNFYQPQLVVAALTAAFEFYRSLADEHSGIP